MSPPPPFYRIEMNLQNEGQGHMDRLRENNMSSWGEGGGGGGGGRDRQNCKG